MVAAGLNDIFCALKDLQCEQPHGKDDSYHRKQYINDQVAPVL
jgi:hypothetical protein